jgi:hypothetical protein
MRFNVILTLNLPTSTIVAPPSNASKWQMGFNSAFKGLMVANTVLYVKQVWDLRTCSVSVMVSIFAKNFSVWPPHMRIEILTAVTTRNDVLLVLMTSSFIKAYRSFGGAYCLHLQCRGLGRTKKRHDVWYVSYVYATFRNSFELPSSDTSATHLGISLLRL